MGERTQEAEESEKRGVGELPICASLQTDREAEDVEVDQRRRSRRDHKCREGAIVSLVCVRESRLERPVRRNTETQQHMQRVSRRSRKRETRDTAQPATLSTVRQVKRSVSRNLRSR